MATEDAARRRGPSAKGWALIAGLALIGLIAVLIGVALLADSAKPCGCAPLPPSSTPSTSA
jgi:hypothetical protein